MTGETDSLIILPLPHDDAADGGDAMRFAWWKCVQGKCVQHGESGNVLAAASRSPEQDIGPVILLLPATICAVARHRFSDITAPQALAAARMAALENSIGDDDALHVSALVTESGQDDDAMAHHVQTVVIESATLDAVLSGCKAIGLDPDHILPAALVVPRHGEECFRFTLGPYGFLRAPAIAAEDDPALRELLIGDRPSETMDEDAVVAALGSLSERALPDLRQGGFAKKVDRSLLAPEEKRIIAGLLAVLVVVTLLIPGIRLLRYQAATDSVVEETVSQAQQVLPSVTDLDSAEQQVDAALLERGTGPRIFSAPAAALFAIVQRVENITIRDLGYRADGMLTAVVAAPDNATMNQLLLPLQEQGYTITATQRQEAGGATVIDLTVRG
ncbi:MAG: type II secretion system protein GspL [Pseudomonadota bacterium]